MLGIIQIGRGEQIVERAYVMIDCETGYEMDVLDELKSNPGVKEAHLTMGKHDIIALLEGNSLENLRETIVEKIGKIPHVTSTTTLMPQE